MQVLHQHSLPKTNSNTPHGRKYFLPTKITQLRMLAKITQRIRTKIFDTVPVEPGGDALPSPRADPIQTPYGPHAEKHRVRIWKASGVLLRSPAEVQV